LKEFEKSIADYTIAIGMEPANADAYAGRGSAAHALGRTDQAAVDLKKACSLGSEAGCKSLKALTKNK
jgi:tetratricopeptide (TPR) repeat protein